MSSGSVRKTRKQPSVRARSIRKGTRTESASMAREMRSGLELQALQGFRTIFGSARAHDTEVRRISGISGSQLWALAEIVRSAGMTVNGLSEQMALHQTTASNLVNALVERKVIRRVRDAADHRVIHLHVTVEGRRMLLRAPGPYSGLLVDALRHLDGDALERLCSSLSVLVGVMRGGAGGAAGETLMGE
jgi:MarR family transcriptional regulator, organic hydroperoxide resistance regulator